MKFRIGEQDFLTFQDWLEDISYHAGWNEPAKSLIALKIVIQELRNQLPLDLLVAVGRRLPLIVRGLYFEDWYPPNLSPDTLDHYRFSKLIHERLESYPSIDPNRAIKAVFKTMGNHLADYEIEYLRRTLPGDILSFWLLAT